VQANTILTASVAAVDTTDHLAEEALVEQITVYPTSNIVAGVSFELEGYAPNQTWGMYKVNVIGG
jgi:hypothetical protein